MRNLWGHNWRLHGEVKGYMFDNGGCMPYNVWYKGRYRAALAVEKLFSCCDQNLKIWSCPWPLSFFCSSSSSSSSYSLSCLSSSTKTSSPNHHYYSHVHMFTIWRQKLFCCFFSFSSSSYFALLFLLLTFLSNPSGTPLTPLTFWVRLWVQHAKCTWSSYHSSSSSSSLSCLSWSATTSSLPNHHYHSHIHMFTISLVAAIKI